VRKQIAIATITGSLVGGTVVGALVLGPPALSGADPGLTAVQTDPDDTSTTTEDTTATTTEDTTEDTTATTEETTDDERGPGDFLADALAPLVEDGTITQAQADAVIAAIEEAKPNRPHGPGFPGRHGANLDVVATALGIEESELIDELTSGMTIADIAAERGVDVQVVIDAIVADRTARIDEAVADGRITEEEATERKADLVQVATDIVNGEFPLGGPGRGPWGPGPWGDGD